MKISIVTSTYNSDSTIEETLKSVLCQTYCNWEIIVVDGASTDGTTGILKKYEPLMGGRMRWISEPDKGIYDAMNKGIRLASGDIIGILNSDDYYTTDDILQTIINTYNEEEKNSGQKLDAIYGDVHYIKPGAPDICVRYYSSAIFRPWKLRIGFMPAHPSFYCRREVYDKVGLYSTDYHIASDFDMMVRVFHCNSFNYRYIKKDFVTMRTGGISTRNLRNRILTTCEDVKACTSNGLYTNIFLVSIKYITKVFEFKLF